mgnify:CR=1
MHITASALIAKTNIWAGVYELPQPARERNIIMWKNQYGDTFETEFDARLDASETMDTDEVLDWIIDHYSSEDIIRLMGDIGVELMIEALDDYFQENYDFVKEDETNES